MSSRWASGVLDPACGSGTFLFHAIKRFLNAADEAGMNPADSLTARTRHVRGIDVHPVAVQIARVTYLLALSEARLRQRPGELQIPVYIGDSLQWNTTGFMTAREVQIDVPKDKQPLHFPFRVAQDPGLFDSVINRMLALSDQDAASEALASWLDGLGLLDSADVGSLVRTYEHLRRLKKAGRNHIWGFVARNLVRPAWLSRDDEKSDVIIGNPPWLAYRYMSADTKKAFKKACSDRGLWTGGKVATHQDLSAYFFARSVELYFPLTGVIAFVMPYAAMSRQQYEGFRKGVFGQFKARAKAERVVFIRFNEGWVFSDNVQPLFPVPSCVLFGELRSIGSTGPVLPATVKAASGQLPRREATAEEAAASLHWSDVPWPNSSSGVGSSYESKFWNGATIFPRVLSVVERRDPGRLGANPVAPIVESRRTNQKKIPWRNVASLRHNVEAQYLRPLYLGESVAPFRLLTPALAVIPWDESRGKLLDAGEAQATGNVNLAGWLANADKTWRKHSRSKMTFVEQLDYYGKLSAQFPIASLRLIYSKAGSLPACAILRDQSAIVENRLYWARPSCEGEAYYLMAVLNSETARSSAEKFQSRGQWGARDFDKAMLKLPIPEFDPSCELHAHIGELAQRATDISAAVALEPEESFVRSRTHIRDALHEDGVADEIDALVADLLGPAS